MTKKIFLAFAVLALAVIGCHAQLPPTPGYNVVWSWTAPVAAGNWAGCTTSAPCTYVISVATLATGVTTCPVTTGTAYTPLNSASPVSGVSYTQTNATGTTVCGLVQVLQTQSGQTATSVPSNTFLVAVPAVPLAPTLQAPTTQVAALDGKPELMPVPSVELASNDPTLPVVLHLTAALVKR